MVNWWEKGDDLTVGDIARDPVGIVNIDAMKNEFDSKKYTPLATDFGQYDREQREQNQEQIALDRQRASGAQNRIAPTSYAAGQANVTGYGGANVNLAPSNQFRGGQSDLAAALLARAQGQGGPSPAELQMRRGQEQASRRALGLAASQSGVAPGLALRQAQDAQSQMLLDTNQQTAILRSQEQMQAEQALGGLLQGARGQDLGAASEQARLLQEAGLFSAGAQNQAGLQKAGFNQQTGLANQQAQITQQQLNDQFTQYYESLGFSREQAQQQAAQQAAIAYQNIMSQQQISANAVNQATAESNAQRAQDAEAGVMGMAGGIVGGIVSDKRAKRKVKRADLAEALNERARANMNAEESSQFKGYKPGQSKAETSEADERAMANMNAEEAADFQAQRQTYAKTVAQQRHEESNRQRLADLKAAMGAKAADPTAESIRGKVIYAPFGNPGAGNYAPPKWLNLESQPGQVPIGIRRKDLSDVEDRYLRERGSEPLVSDENAKTAINDKAPVEEFLDNTNAYEYEYIDPKNGEGKHYGTMAQELMKSKMGRSFVFRRDDGLLALDPRKGFGPTLASLSYLNKRQKALEAKLAALGGK